MAEAQAKSQKAQSPIKRPPALRAKTKNQKSYLRKLKNKEHDILFVVGPAGTGKTYMAVRQAITWLQSTSDFQKIVITRPNVSTGDDIGYLPGTLREKMQPWMLPITDVFEECYSPAEVSRLIAAGDIEIAPLAFMRGRAQPLNSVVMTPDGPRQMGDLRVGDMVLGSDGRSTPVTGIFPQGPKKCFRVTFCDGTTTIASEDHLWMTETRSEKRHKKGASVKTTKEIAETLRLAHQRNHATPILSAPAEYGLESDLPIDPYVMGLLLGDGCLHEKASITFTTEDDELFEAIAHALPPEMKITPVDGLQARISWKDQHQSKPNPWKKWLRETNSIGTSPTKTIPETYLNGLWQYRFSLLQGLMDTDGTIFNQEGRRARVEFSSTSEALAQQVAHIVRSLGGLASIRTRDYTHEFDAERTPGFNPHRHNTYTVRIRMPKTMNPFRLRRKALKFMRSDSHLVKFFDSIESVGEIECQCISVGADDSLYLTDDFIVTHNTFKDSIVIADEMQNATPEQMKMLLTRIGHGSIMIVTGDPEQWDRVQIGNVSGLRDILSRCNAHKLDQKQSLPEFVTGPQPPENENKIERERIGVVRLTRDDVMRHPAIENVLKLYDL